MHFIFTTLAIILFVTKFCLHGYMIYKVHNTTSFMVESSLARLWILLPIFHKFPSKYDRVKQVSNVCYYTSVVCFIISFFTQHLR
jgi:hypothetical protein